MSQRSCIRDRGSLDPITAAAVGSDEPVTDPVRALATMAQFLSRPARRELIALVLDQHDHGSTIMHSTERHPDDVFDLAVAVAGALGPEDRSVVLLSRRPAGRCDPDDARRWLVLDDLFHGCDIRLVDWFVLATTLDRPGIRAGVTPRWP